MAGIFKRLGENLALAVKKLDELEAEIQEKNTLKIDTMQSPPIMNHRDFMFGHKVSREEMVDMKENKDSEKIERRDSIIATNQRLEKIARIITRNERDIGKRDYKEQR